MPRGGVKGRETKWTPGAVSDLSRLYAATGLEYLSHSELAAKINELHPELGGITTNAIVGKVHRLKLHLQFPRGSMTASFIGKQTRGRKLNTGHTEKKIALKVAKKVERPEPPRVKAHVVDPARHCSMEQAMHSDTCLWPVNGGACGCDRDPTAPLSRPTSYCPTHRKIGSVENRRSAQSDAYVTTRQRHSAMRYR